jgi:hypothetical protein
VAQFTISELQALEAEFNGLAKRMKEIHESLGAQAASDVPVQKRYFFYSGIVEVEMNQELFTSIKLEPSQVTPQFVKNQIEVVIMDETPFVVSEYGGYCSEIAGNKTVETIDLSGEEEK